LTLLELLSGVLCFGLIVVVVSRAFAASVESRQHDSLERLVTLHRAAAVYRFEADDQWPTLDAVMNTHLGYGSGYFVSPCANTPGYMKRKSGVSYMYLWTKQREWIYEDSSQNAPLFVDLDCNLSHEPRGNKPQVGLGVTAEGRQLILKKQGDPRRWSWWVGE
jgi:hypothetical protein